MLLNKHKNKLYTLPSVGKLVELGYKPAVAKKIVKSMKQRKTQGKSPRGVFEFNTQTGKLKVVAEVKERIKKSQKVTVADLMFLAAVQRRKREAQKLKRINLKVQICQKISKKYLNTSKKVSVLIM